MMLLVNLQPVHFVSVSVNVIWVPSQVPCDEHVHQFQMFAILVIKPRIFNPISRQSALILQAVCTQIVVHGLKCYQPSLKSMKRIQCPKYWVVAHFTR